ncbi:hypothetical protein LPJ74_002455 [Coemansia sp. RSA 1843]|nr:hypothetical protein LPJ74_002455 [Coemansia sp. RSA 1843]
MNMSTPVSRPESVTGFTPSHVKQVHAPVATKPSNSRKNHQHHQHHDPPPRKHNNAQKTSHQAPQNGLRNSASKGKLNNSDQRASTSKKQQDESDNLKNEEGLSTPTKGGRHRGSRGGRQKQKQPDMSVKPPSADNNSKTSKAAKQRGRRRQPSPPYLDNNNGSGSDDVVLLQSSSPSTSGNPQQQRTPDRRLNKQHQQRPASTPGGAFGPPPRMAGGDVSSTASLPAFGSPSRVRSPMSASRSNHYAGASFNNSPAPSSLPMPPLFLTSPPKSSARTSVTRDEDVFGTSGVAATSPERPMVGNGGYQQMPPSLALQPPPAFAYHHADAPSFGSGSVNAALNERSRQLESMLASNGGTVVYPQQHQYQQHQPQYYQHQQQNTAAMVAGMHGSYSSVDLTQVGGNMTNMFQKLRLIKEMANNRPATVSPIANTNQINQLAPVYNA